MSQKEDSTLTEDVTTKEGHLAQNNDGGQGGDGGVFARMLCEPPLEELFLIT